MFQMLMPFVKKNVQVTWIDGRLFSGFYIAPEMLHLRKAPSDSSPSYIQVVNYEETFNVQWQGATFH